MSTEEHGLHNPSALGASELDRDDRPAIAYDGRGREIFRLVVGNAFLALFTAGLYRFWARTRIRRYLWNHLSFAGDRIEYMGRPDELMIGLFIVAAVFIPAVVALGLATDLLSFGAPEAAGAYQLGALLVLFILGQLAAFRARRYRLSRTVWRGLRFHQSGSAIGYTLRWLGWTILTVLSVGLLLPFRNKSLHRYRIRNTWLGDQRMIYDDGAGSPWLLMPRWLLCWLLFVPTLGTSYAWYRAAELRYLIARTRLGALAPTLAITGWRVLKIYLWPAILGIIAVIAVSALFNGLLIHYVGPDPWITGLADRDKVPAWVQPLVQAVLVLFVLGIVQQIVLHRQLRTVGGGVILAGALDPASLHQNPARPSAFGEGLADVLDVGGL